MRVHLYGNTLNLSYNLAGFLRRFGIDAHFFLDNYSPALQDYPWWEDSNITLNNLPSWLHYYPSKPFFLLPSKITNKMISDFSKCDIALVSGYGPIVAMKAKIPFVFYSIGSDLNCINVQEEVISVFRSRGSLKSKLFRLIKIICFTPLQKKAIEKKASRILVSMGYQINPYINKYNLGFKTTLTRLPWDIEKYYILPNVNLTEKYKQFDIVFFMISRHQFSSVWLDIKGNDKFLRAFGSFVKTGNKNVKLILINKGTDVNISKKIIADLNINKYVEWVEQMEKSGIRDFESIPNCVVVDQFWHDDIGKRYKLDKDNPKMGFGFGAIEAMAAAKPLITAFSDTKFYNELTPAIFSCFTEKEILNSLLTIYEMSKEMRKEIGKKGQKFVKQWHGYENVIPLYIDELKKVLEMEKKP
jgi:glycosyltransferase involved in cell wall biosynthesis